MRALATAIALLATACISGGERGSEARVATTDVQAGTTSTSMSEDVHEDEPGSAVDRPLLFLYSRGGEVRGVLDTGRTVVLEGVSEAPRLAGDGRTILFSRGEWPDDEAVVLDAQTGEERVLDGFGRGGYFGTPGELVVSDHRAIVPMFDPDGLEPTRLAVLELPSLDVQATIALGAESAGKHHISSAWDADQRALLMFTWDTESAWAWWWIDLERGTASRVRVADELNPTQHEPFFLGPARMPGVFPVLLEGWGELQVDDGVARFVATDPPGPDGPGHLEIDRFWDLGPRAVVSPAPGVFEVSDGQDGGRLVSYWDMYAEDSARLLYVAPDGTTELLLDEVSWIDGA